MRLELEELARCLNMTPDTVERWIRQGSIPVRKKASHCTFSIAALKQWAQENSLTFSMPDKTNRAAAQPVEDSFLSAMERGGVLYDISGDTVERVLHAAVERIRLLPEPEQKKALYESLIAREELMSTGIGNGVAIPHPRKPLLHESIPAFITTCFLKEPVAFQAVDKKPVFVLFVIVCPTSKSHLYLLSRLSFCLRDDGFITLLKGIPDARTFFSGVKVFQRQFDASG